jgi:hypothetical protein
MDVVPVPGEGHTETTQQKARRDATPDLLLKHLNTIVPTSSKADETLKTCF